jgi:hypothetical protein
MQSEESMFRQLASGESLSPYFEMDRPAESTILLLEPLIGAVPSADGVPLARGSFAVVCTYS